MTRFTNRKERKMRFSEFKFQMIRIATVVLLINAFLMISVGVPILMDSGRFVLLPLAVAGIAYVAVLGFLCWRWLSIHMTRQTVGGLYRLTKSLLPESQTEVLLVNDLFNYTVMLEKSSDSDVFRVVVVSNGRSLRLILTSRSLLSNFGSVRIRQSFGVELLQFIDGYSKSLYAVRAMIDEQEKSLSRQFEGLKPQELDAIMAQEEPRTVRAG
ncbi:hypothetical protein KI440_02370 [Candidatus Saccharibacteria bacterium TM7i]|nr:hypothetical protein KI440_02370 [Candidatus Saccharibacteria bacterium TM7i]